MSKRRKPNHKIMFLRVLICLLLLGNVPNGLVLCFGADGHVELELASHKKCVGADHQSSVKHSESPGVEELHQDHKHCQPCADIPILNTFTRGFPVPHQRLGTISLAVAVFIPDSSLETDISGLPVFYLKPNLKSPHLKSLRSVILLT
jgi:hypothetical protein